MFEPCLKLVLVAPEIPYNTNAIGRTCVALNLELILIKPYRFPLDEKAVPQAGTDYWKHVHLSEYDSWENFLADRKPPHESLYCFEELGAQTIYAPDYQHA
jgi:tRNA (cytidine/uridine-2'-O-)-methyltransferase